VHSVRVRDFAQWREAARHCIASEIEPAEIFWSDARAAGVFDALGPGEGTPDRRGGSAGSPGQKVSQRRAGIPRALLELLEGLALYRK
jgi:hypothetical protein